MEDEIKITRNKYPRSTNDIIYQGEALFDNYKLDSEITEVCTRIGYNEERMNEGEALFNSFVLEYESQQDVISQKLNSTKNVHDKLDEVYLNYIRIIKFSQVAFKDDVQTAILLKLYSKRPRSFADKITVISEFYNNINSSESRKAKLAVYGITQEEIDNNITLLSELSGFDSNQEILKGESKHKTKLKNSAYNSYNEWLVDFKKLIRIELRDNLELLDKIFVK